jgi:hypothetical protein
MCDHRNRRLGAALDTRAARGSLWKSNPRRSSLGYTTLQGLVWEKSRDVVGAEEHAEGVAAQEKLSARFVFILK